LKRTRELGAEFHFPRNEQYALPHSTIREYGDEEERRIVNGKCTLYNLSKVRTLRKKHHLVTAITFEDLFYAVSGHAFVMHQLIELLFQ
jgi:hypothetical protein